MIKRYAWTRPLTAYESAAAWRAKRAAMYQKFKNSQAAGAAALSDATMNQVTGSGDIAARIATARIAAEKAAKAEAAKNATPDEPIDTSKADIKDSMFSDSSTGKLDSGTSIDLAGGTITLSNGKVIDIRSGARVNYTA